MRITSLEIKQHEFEKSFRGYNVDEVNHYLNSISEEWDRMLNEIKVLRMQLDVAEKEASKLKEVESTLIKTLRTAEETGNQIKEKANLEASNTLSEANQKADRILKDAENTSKQMVLDTENKVKDIQDAAKKEISELDVKYNFLEAKRSSLLKQLKSINSELSNIVENGETEIQVDTAKLEASVSKSVVVVEETELIVEKSVDDNEKVISDTADALKTVEEGEEVSVDEVSFSSAVNQIHLEKEDDQTDLEIIEGIGPKIKEVLNNAGIKNFRALATTPEYRLRDILAAAGSHFVAHDPSTWNEQALLAANKDWEKLEELKSRLIAGRTPKEEPVLEGSNTEEMLEKVNKVKAAIRKAMVEKPEPEVQAKDDSKSSSFFDSI